MQRIKTREVKIGNLYIGGNNPVRIQTMTTTDTMDTEASVAQIIRCIDAGAELVRLTAPSIKEAKNLKNIKDLLNKKGYFTPLVADIHFTPNAAEIAAGIVEKVRVNPGNYIDKKKFDLIEYSDEEYLHEIQRIKERFTPLVLICKQNNTAMRIGTNHGSLSDRIMSRYGDTDIGMVESAMEFLRIARSLDYHQIVLSMKSSNPSVMISAYRTLVKKMLEEFGECYPLHLGVTEAGDGEDGRIKSAIGIGALLSEGIGDTIRVSLTEEPEYELPVCKNILEKYEIKEIQKELSLPKFNDFAPSPKVPKVIVDVCKIPDLKIDDFSLFGYNYNAQDDKWNYSDQASDFIFCNTVPKINLPGNIGVITYYEQWLPFCANPHCYPLFDILQYLKPQYIKHEKLNFVMLDARTNVYSQQVWAQIIEVLKKDKTVHLCISSTHNNAINELRLLCEKLHRNQIFLDKTLIVDSNNNDIQKSLIHYAVEAGTLLLEGKLQGLCLGYQFGNTLKSKSDLDKEISFLHSITFGILQATRTRISKTEYISCPSCGRTLFDLQETTAKIRAVTNHLKGVKIAIMGCIVNGPGEMADADFGYVGSGVGKITLYKNKEIVKRNINSEIAVDELIMLLKESGVWQEPTLS